MLLGTPKRKPVEGKRSGTAVAPAVASTAPVFSRYPPRKPLPSPGSVVTAPALRIARAAVGQGATVGVPGSQVDNAIPYTTPAADVPLFSRYPTGGIRRVGRQPITRYTLAAVAGPVRLSGLLLSLGGVALRAPPAPSTDLFPASAVWSGSPAGEVVGDFPVQFAGVRLWHNGAVVELCMVATADAPAGMGGQPRISHGGTTYALYLVETADGEASPARLVTSAGTKSIRNKT